MTTMTLNIQDNSIVPHLLEVLSQIKGVTIVHSSNHSYSILHFNSITRGIPCKI